MANSNITLEIAETVQKVYAKLRPWDSTPKVSLLEHNDGFFVRTGYDDLGYVKTFNGNWFIQCNTTFGSISTTKPTTLKDAIAYLIKGHFNMR